MGGWGEKLGGVGGLRKELRVDIFLSSCLVRNVERMVVEGVVGCRGDYKTFIKVGDVIIIS